MLEFTVFGILVFSILFCTIVILIRPLRKLTNKPDISAVAGLIKEVGTTLKLGLFFLITSVVGLYLYVGRPDLLRQPEIPPATAKLHQAIIELEAFVKNNPTQIEAVYILADSYRALGKYQQALFYYEQLDVLARQQNFILPAEYYALIAETRINLYGLRDNNAATLLEKALKIDQRNPRALFYQALIKAELGNIDQAITELRQLRDNVRAIGAWVDVINRHLERLGAKP
jgi:cytochrome c-type biogenesis protein CcmH/NrfG